MKHFIILLTVLYIVSAKSISEVDENSETPNLRLRHRRRSWEPNDYYYDNKAYYGRRQEEMLSEITSLLQEISIYVKRPPPPPPQPPQIIYVPYPVPYPTSGVGYSSNSNSTVPCVSLSDRVKVDDPNRIWQQTPGVTNIDNGNDGDREVSFKPIKPKETVPEPPPVEHGSEQAGMSTTTTEATPRKSLICQAAIIICCDKSDEEKKKCFDAYRCSRTFATGVACHPAVVKKAYEEFISQYANSD